MAVATPDHWHGPMALEAMAAGAKPQVLIAMAVESYREGKILHFDEKNWKVTDRPPKAQARGS